MGKFLEYWKMAFFNIRSNKVRAFLTMLGIIIGISSVVAVLSVGNGVQNMITGSLSGLAGSYFEVYVNGDKLIPKSTVEALVKKYPEITGYSENLAFQATAQGQKEELKYVFNSGSPDLAKSKRDEIIYGRYFTQEEYENGAKVVVIDTKGAKAIFGREDVLGEVIPFTAYGRDFSVKVIGIRKSAESALDGFINGGSNRYNAEIPSSVFYNLFGLYDSGEFTDVMIFVDSLDHVADMSVKGERFVEASMDLRGQDAVQTFELSSTIGELSGLMTGITVFVMLVAGISLFVGGVGVMNIMLVSVTERTREIGIRKSLGARTSSILWQFLIESGTISLMGGIIGIIIGLAFSFLASFIVRQVGHVDMTPDFNILVILGIAAFSMGIGVVFGLFPARKAAKMTPIEALRHK